MSSTSTIGIFCCYARKDQLSMQSLKTHLMPLQRQGLITVWSDSDINAGANWHEEIEKHLDTAQIILLLVSPDFIASEYCYSKEMTRAMDCYKRNETRVIPIILRPTHWQGTPFATIQALPKDAKPITKWNTEDDALYDVVESIGNIVKELRTQQLSQEALERMQERRYVEALLLFDQCIILDPDYAYAHLYKGQTLLALEKYEECLVSFEKAATINANLADTYLYENKAIALKNLQRVDESLVAYDEAIRLDLSVLFPPSVRAVSLYNQKARLLCSLQRFTEALSLLKQSMPYRMLCNDAQREDAKPSPGLASRLFCHVPLHNFWYGIDYESPGWNQKYPRIQIYTITELLKGVKVEMPSQYGTFKQAPKVKQDGAGVDQNELFEGNAI